MANDEGIQPTPGEDDPQYDEQIRPQRLDDFPGQEPIKDKLRISIAASKQRNEPLDHMLMSGPPGLGKTTLARIMAHEMGVDIKSTSGPVIERQADLSAILTSLEEFDILFIDEIHRLNHAVEETLYSEPSSNIPFPLYYLSSDRTNRTFCLSYRFIWGPIPARPTK